MKVEGWLFGLLGRGVEVGGVAVEKQMEGGSFLYG